MIFLAWVAFLLLLTLLFSGLLERQNNPNQRLMVAESDDGHAALVLKRNRRGHYVAPGVIDGVPVVFLLDTGATYVAIPEVIADEVGAKRGVMATSLTANGVVKSWMTELENVRLGPFSMSGVKAAIMPTMPGSEVLLGMSFLQHLEIIQKGNELILQLPGGSRE
jgi:aspartyl protease family protein